MFVACLSMHLSDAHAAVSSVYSSPALVTCHSLGQTAGMVTESSTRCWQSSTVITLQAHAEAAIFAPLGSGKALPGALCCSAPLTLLRRMACCEALQSLTSGLRRAHTAGRAYTPEWP